MLLNDVARLFDLLMMLVAVTLAETTLPNSHECVHDRVNVDAFIVFIKIAIVNAATKPSVLPPLL